jgi:hypothetical protein
MEPEKSGPIPIMCMRVGGKSFGIGPSLVPGAAPLDCCECKLPVWASPSSTAAIKAGTHVAICMECALPHIEKHQQDTGEPTEIGLVEGAAEEAITYFQFEKKRKGERG